MIYLQLFLAFLQIGLFSFGGGYAAVPLIQSQIVENNGWLTIEQFTDLITLSEMTPGPIAVNCATFVGQQLAGFPGAIICTLGCVFPSFCIVVLLSYLYMRFRSLKVMQGILAGLRPAIVAMIASAGVTILVLALFQTDLQGLATEGSFQWVEAILFGVGFFLLRKFRLNPILIIFGAGIAGTLLYILLPI